MEAIIKSILDTDLYKISMQCAVMHKFPRAKVKYAFINRGRTSFPEGFAEELRNQIKFMEDLALSREEKKWLKDTCYYLDPTYLDFLSGYRYNSSEVNIIQEDSDLQIFIEGSWVNSILWEVPLMALISELYFHMTNQEAWDYKKRSENNQEKITLFRMNGIHYADFGTRRRYSYGNQMEVVKQMSSDIGNENFVGTSNVHFAHLFGVKPIGTHAHEWFMFHAAKYGYKMANHLAMENWTDVFRGDLGIALSDTFTSEVFFKSFDKKFAKLYDGIRHDSGDPMDFADKVVLHYKKLGIDPKTKVIVFSDSLNP